MKPSSTVLPLPCTVIPPVSGVLFSGPYLVERFGARKFCPDLRDALHADLTREILEELTGDLPFVYGCDVGPEEWRVTYHPDIPESVIESLILKHVPSEKYYLEFVRRFYDRAVDAGAVEV